MAKKAMLEREKKRKKMAKKASGKYQQLKEKFMNKNTSAEERVELMFALSNLPRNSRKIRQHNRCGLTGRPRGYYRKFGLSRIALRDLSSIGLLPGVTKSSW